MTRSLRARVTAFFFLGAFLPFAVALLLVTLRDVRRFRQELTTRAQVLASVLTSHLAAELAFDAPEEAARSLAALSQETDLEVVAVYDRDGDLFASYVAGPAQTEPPGSSLSVSRPPAPGSVELQQAVTHRGTRYGTLYLRLSKRELQGQIGGYLSGVAAVALAAGLFAWLLAGLLRRAFFRPLLEVTQMVDQVASRADYSARLDPPQHEELRALVDAFNTLQAELQRRQERAERAIQTREDFLSIASHELKTPLTPLKLQLQFLQREALPAAVRERVDKILRQERKLEKLIANLLDVSRITRGHVQLEREEVELSALAAEVCERLASEPGGGGTPIRLRAPPELKGHWDRSRLEQILTNLLTNAIKYGGQKPVEVEIDGADDAARVTVTDQGLGISPEDQQRIFERFERAVPASQYGGLGLGLYITRQLVLAHGGTIEVLSAPGQGSSFVVTLPRGASAAPRPEPYAPAPQ